LLPSKSAPPEGGASLEVTRTGGASALILDQVGHLIKLGCIVRPKAFNFFSSLPIDSICQGHYIGLVRGNKTRRKQVIRFANPHDQQQGPNCGVTALSIVAGISFFSAWSICKGVSRTKRFKGGMYDNDIIDSLNAANVKFRKLKHVDVYWKTVQNFVAESDPAKTYYIVSTGHAQVSHNGQVADQCGVKDVAKYWGRRKKIKFVLEIIEDQENSCAMHVFGLPLFDHCALN